MAEVPPTRPSLLVRMRDAHDQAAWADFVRLYGTSGGDRVVSFRVTPASADFKDEIEMTVEKVSRLPCRTLEQSAVQELLPP